MPTVRTTSSAPGDRVRVAISSPEILAHIRREFASKGLIVRIDGPPTVDVVVTTDPGIAPDPGGLAEALARIAGPDSYRRDPATARYRLVLVPVDQPRRPATAEPRKAVTAPAYAESRPLSPREAEVMESISQGLRNADIAAALRVSEKTVKNHVNRIFTKLGAQTRIEAVLIWQSGTA